MNNEDKIREGDIVSINFNNAQITLTNAAEILYAPYQMGESWVVRDLDTQQIHYISEGCTITVKGRKKKTDE